jgi:hypothetical protein
MKPAVRAEPGKALRPREPTTEDLFRHLASVVTMKHPRPAQMTVLSKHLLQNAGHGDPSRPAALRDVRDAFPNGTLHVNRAPLEVEIGLLEADDLSPTKACIEDPPIPWTA